MGKNWQIIYKESKFFKIREILVEMRNIFAKLNAIET